MNSNPSSPQRRVSSTKLALLLVLMLIGFADASFLAVEHYKGVVPPCAIVTGCETVTTSKYSEIYSIPVSLFGALYYLAMLVLVVAYWDMGPGVLLQILFGISAAGFLASLGLVYLQLFVLHAICLYCMGSAVTSTLVFGVLFSSKRIIYETQS
jgi:uncharacterized membrane protein